MKWLPIEYLGKTERGMFVVKAINVSVTHTGHPYTTDPYCVWRESDGTFARWPHKFLPTHFCILPEDPKE